MTAAGAFQAQQPSHEARRIRQLERTIGELRETVRQLEEALSPRFLAPTDWRLSPSQHRVLGALLARDMVTKEQVLMLVRGEDGSPVSQGYSNVVICNLRRTVKGYGLSIKTQWGIGYYLVDRLAWRDRLR